MSKEKVLTEGQKAFQSVFVSHAWGSRRNGGKSYRRPYSKTKSSAKEYMKSIGMKLGPAKGEKETVEVA